MKWIKNLGHWQLIVNLLVCGVAIVSTAFAAAEQTTDNIFMIKSTSFHDQGIIDDRYTCDGRDISPGFMWKNIPKGTQSIVLTFTDLDANIGIFYHWILYDMPPTITSLEEAITELPPGTKVGKNSWNKQTYNGPCPPPNSSHYYVVTLYALNKKLNVDNIDGKQLTELLQNAVIDKAEIGVTYKH